MIVFTATHKESGKIFVGSARDSIENTWALLLTQAEDGANGDFFAILRAEGASGFSLEEWAYADSSRELRDLMREAQHDIGAEPIKAGLGKPLPKTVIKSSRVRELMGLDESDGGDDEPFTEWLASKRDEKPSLVTPKPQDDRQSVESSTVSTSSSREIKVTFSKIANGRTGSTSKEKRIREAIEQQRVAREQLRQTGSTQDATEMRTVMASIEARRLAMKKKPAAKKPAATKAGAAGNAVASLSKPASSAQLPPKKPSTASTLAKGRTGSSAKEKRIKEAIALEKAERDSQRQSQTKAQADEMAAILARLDSRNKEAAKTKRRR